MKILVDSVWQFFKFENFSFTISKAWYIHQFTIFTVFTVFTIGHPIPNYMVIPMYPYIALVEIYHVV